MDNFEHVIARWEISILTHFKTMFHSSPPWKRQKKQEVFRGYRNIGLLWVDVPDILNVCGKET